jgi:hypothetical protein
VEEFCWCIDRTLDFGPTITLDDGADLIFRAHSPWPRPDLIPGLRGGTEETTTGVHRLRAMAAAGQLRCPVIAVNDAETKWNFDNVCGTGQSPLDGILRATSVLLAGKNFVVSGCGHCGRGCALRARGQGANAIVAEVKPTATLKAFLDGNRVMAVEEAPRIGDTFIAANAGGDARPQRGLRDLTIVQEDQTGAVANVRTLELPDFARMPRFLELEKPSFKPSALSAVALGSAGGGTRPQWGLRDLTIVQEDQRGAAPDVRTLKFPDPGAGKAQFQSLCPPWSGSGICRRGRKASLGSQGSQNRSQKE